MSDAEAQEISATSKSLVEAYFTVRYWPWVNSLSSLFPDYSSEAEDVIMEIFKDVSVKEWNSAEEIGKYFGYCARKRALGLIEQSKARRRRENRYTQRTQPCMADPIDPAVAVVRKEQEARLDAVLSQLTKAEQVRARLYAYGLGAEERAGLLDVTPGTERVKTHRLMKKIARLMSQAGEERA
ncbi:hypothetical protein ABZZ80_07515 [Streptomyces sp. NPDC006356]